MNIDGDIRITEEFKISVKTTLTRIINDTKNLKHISLRSCKPSQSIESLGYKRFIGYLLQRFSTSFFQVV